MQFRIYWANDNNAGHFDCEAQSTKDAFIESIRSGICSLEWRSIHKLSESGEWVELPILSDRTFPKMIV
jgi:hypothetical protein